MSQVRWYLKVIASPLLGWGLALLRDGRTEIACAVLTAGIFFALTFIECCND